MALLYHNCFIDIECYSKTVVLAPSNTTNYNTIGFTGTTTTRRTFACCHSQEPSVHRQCDRRLCFIAVFHLSTATTAITIETAIAKAIAKAIAIAKPIIKSKRRLLPILDHSSPFSIILNTTRVPVVDFTSFPREHKSEALTVIVTVTVIVIIS